MALPFNKAIIIKTLAAITQSSCNGRMQAAYFPPVGLQVKAMASLLRILGGTK